MPLNLQSTLRYAVSSTQSPRSFLAAHSTVVPSMSLETKNRIDLEPRSLLLALMDMGSCPVPKCHRNIGSGLARAEHVTTVDRPFGTSSVCLPPIVLAPLILTVVTGAVKKLETREKDLIISLP